jgi:hypothetical protein
MVFIFFGCSQIIDPKEELKVSEDYIPFQLYPSRPQDLFILKTEIHKFNKDLKLYSIENGFDSAQFRFWFITDPYQDSSYHCLIVKKYKEKPWQVIQVDFSYPIIGGQFSMYDESLVKWESNDLSSKLSNSGLAFLDSLPFNIKYMEDIEYCIKTNSYTSKKIIMEQAKIDTYSLSYFSAPISLNDSCRATVSLDLERFLRELQQSFGLTFINDYFEE